MSMRRNDVASTSVRRHFDFICPLGQLVKEKMLFYELFLTVHTRPFLKEFVFQLERGTTVETMFASLVNQRIVLLQEIVFFERSKFFPVRVVSK